MTQQAFAQAVGLSNKSRVCLIERGGPVSLPVALRLEALSGGRIRADALNADVAAARMGCVCDVPHAPADSGGLGCASALNGAADFTTGEAA